MLIDWLRRLSGPVAWCVLSIIIALTLGSLGVFNRLNLMLYDSLMGFQYHSAERVVIVTIDEKSLLELGRWPWSRRTHANMLDVLTESGASAVGFDILFLEEEKADPESDVSFAEAIQRNGNVVLAVAPKATHVENEIQESLPLPLLAESAAALGHVDFELDEDGIGRRLFLNAGLGDARWPAMGLALGRLASPAMVNNYSVDTSGTASVLPTGKENGESFENHASPVIQDSDGWTRSDPLLILFAGPPGHFLHVSFIDVLQRRVDPEVFRDRIVLVGSTATGLGDAISTPSTGAHVRMHGVEVNANVVETLLSGNGIVPLGYYFQTLLTIVLVITATLLVFLPPAKFAPLGLLLSLAATVITSLFMFAFLNLWFPPVSVLIVLVFSYFCGIWFNLQSSTRSTHQLSEQLKQHEQRDPVTQLPNRAMFHQLVQKAIYSARDVDRTLGVMVIHIGRLKTVNDRLGFACGDRLLQMVAERIKHIAGNESQVARLSGGEFGVLVERHRSSTSMKPLGNQLVQLLQRPFIVEESQFLIPPSIGVTLYSSESEDAETLISNAYSAMRQAKDDRHNRLQFFSANLRKETLKRYDLEQALTQALMNNELEVYYQPQVLAEYGRIVGVEALLRWNNDQLGSISPEEFIPVAEATGLIIPIGNWVLEQACIQAQQWRDQNIGVIRMAVNLSAVQFVDLHLVENVRQALEKTGLPPSLLELEVTEGSLIGDLDIASDTLSALKEMGVGLSIDDFGTGYSSLSYIKRLPIDRIKIDRSFVRDIGASEESSDITLAIIEMAHKLKLKVVAEGVETQRQQDFLSGHHCEELQGYYFGRPVPAKELTTLLERNNHTSIDSGDNQ